MSRAGKVDWGAIEREYVFDADTPAVSFTDLADRHKIARSGLAEKAQLGQWYEKRKAFRASVGARVVDAFGDQWAQQLISDRELSAAAMRATIAKYVERLNNGEIKPNAKDAIAAAAALRALNGDAKAAALEEEGKVIDPSSLALPPGTDLRAFIEDAKRLLPGDVEGPAGGDDEGGAEGTGED